MNSVLATRARIVRNELEPSYASLQSKEWTWSYLCKLALQTMNSILAMWADVVISEQNLATRARIAKNELSLSYASSHRKEWTQSLQRELT